MQPTAFDLSIASNAFGFFSIISSMMLDLTSSYSEWLLHPSQLQPLQYWPELNHMYLFRNIRNTVSGTLSSYNCTWNSLYLSLRYCLPLKWTLWISSFWGLARRLCFSKFLLEGISSQYWGAFLSWYLGPMGIPVTFLCSDGLWMSLECLGAPLEDCSW